MQVVCKRKLLYIIFLQSMQMWPVRCAFGLIYTVTYFYF